MEAGKTPLPQRKKFEKLLTKNLESVKCFLRERKKRSSLKKEKKAMTKTEKLIAALEEKGFKRWTKAGKLFSDGHLEEAE